MTLRACALVVLTALVAAPRADAATISIQPDVNYLDVGDVFNVNIIVSDLANDEVVAGAAAMLSFDESIITGVSYAADPSDALGVVTCGLFCDLSFGFGGLGDFDLFIVADLGLDSPTLKANQGDSFVLATLTFQAIAPGITTLALSNAFVTDFDGFTIDAEVEDALVCVERDRACAILAPEPGSLVLFGLGALGLAAVRRRRARV